MVDRIEPLEPLLLLTDVMIYAGSMMDPEGIVEGNSLWISMMTFGTDNGPATLHYRIENTDRGLDGTIYEFDYDGTITFTGPDDFASLSIPTIDNSVDELSRHFRVSFAPGDGMDSVSTSVINVIVFDNDFDSSIAYPIVNVTVYETDVDFILDLGNPSGVNAPVGYWGFDITTEPEDWSGWSSWGTNTVSITITGDQIDEHDEVLSVRAEAFEDYAKYWYGYYYHLYAPWTVEYRVTIIDDDPLPTVYFDANNPETVTDGNIWMGNIIVDGPTEKTVFVDFSTSDGSAQVSEGDYAAVSQPVSITGTTIYPDFKVAIPVSVSTTFNTPGEGAENFFVQLSNPVDLVLSATEPTTQSVLITGASNNPPVFSPDTYFFQVPAFTPLNAIIGQVFATDIDVGDILTYSGGGAKASIQSDGTIILTGSVDSPLGGFLETFTATVTDSTGLTDTAEVTIQYAAWCGWVEGAEIQLEVFDEALEPDGEFVEIFDAMIPYFGTGGNIVSNPEAEVLEFGTTNPGEAVAHHLRLSNIGQQLLMMFETHFEFPDGYFIPGGIPRYSPNHTLPTLDPYLNPEVEFDLVFQSDDAGEHGGFGRLANNDSHDALNERPFDIEVHATVIGPEITVEALDWEYPYNEDLNLIDGVTALDFGTPSTGDPAITRDLRIRNDGNQDLLLGAITLPSGFTTTYSGSQTLLPGEILNFSVTFDPAEGGLIEGEIVIANNDFNESPFNIPVGVLVDEPEIRVSVVNPDSSLTDVPDNSGVVDFGEFFEGSPDTQKWLRVENTGTQVLTFQHFVTVGPFTFLPTWSPAGSQITIAPGASRDFQIEFDSAALPLGVYNGHIHFTNNDANENTFDFDLIGEIIAPEVTVTMLDEMLIPVQSVTDDSTGITFGLANPGFPLTRFFEVRNDGTGSLVLQPVVLTGSQYTLLTNLTAGQILAPSETASFSVAFSADDGGVYAGSVSFVNNDSDEDPFNFSFSTFGGAGDRSGG